MSIDVPSCLRFYRPLYFVHSSFSLLDLTVQHSSFTKIIRIMIGCRSRDSCRKLIFNLEISPLPSQYSLSLLLFMIRNKNQFPVNSEIHHIDTRQHANFHQPSVNVTKYQKGVYYIDVNVFNMLPLI
jgi:hypothetical protein